MTAAGTREGPALPATTLPTPLPTALLTAPSSARRPLRGRADEYARVLRALEHGLRGGCALVAVEGAPGAGKSRFLAECTTAAERLGFTRGHRFPLSVPSGPGETGPDGGPRLIVIDDAHFPGEEAGDPLLAHRHTRYGGGVVWLVARRSGAGSGSPDALLAGSIGPTERIVLGPLRGAAALQVARDVLGVPPSPALARVLNRACGHPRLLVELLEGMREEGTLRVGAREAELVEERIPQRLRVLLQTVLQDYPDQCRQMLRVAAVLGRESQVDVLLSILHVSPSTLLLILDRAVATGALTVGNTRVGFPNELLWRLIADSVPATLREALRRQMAAVGPVPAQPSAQPSVAGTGPEGPAAGGPPDLNGQEYEIVRMIGEGLTNKQIARRLEISPHTVNYHLKKLFRKAGVNSRIALLREVRQDRREASLR
ncbi:helix-turn-helix transcriptional regulator [Streptomyces sp. NPDC003691]